ncbi:hypothetical protein SPI_07920 [Niveomyces insectorum RCEF 264]|uniref:Uncharacterized protein n=1 Tax=Niveomyces insectorum RCEF 264 TaxID=1081102 RepID=A0A167P5E5_9HYPO|nr:hypothetical protein SPI_07920 [Niveomyces insectorum RCEF 264]
MAPQSEPLAKTRKPGCTAAVCHAGNGTYDVSTARRDRALPSCSSCRKARHPRHCTYAGSGLRVRPSIYTERVVTPARSREPLDDRRALALLAATGTGAGSGDDSSTSPPDSTERSDTPAYLGAYVVPSVSSVSSVPTQSSPPPPPPATQDAIATSHPLNQPMHINSPPSPPPPPLSASASLRRWSPSSLPQHMVTDPVDAEVFEFYIRETGVWLNIASPTAYFTEAVPRMALHDSVLYSACLSYAARIMAIRGKLDKARCELYGSRAIAELLARLSARSTDSAHDDALSATVVILRMAEQFSEMQEDMCCHLMGASSLFARNPHHVFDGAVSFWVYKRQSIRMAVLNEEPCEPDVTGIAFAEDVSLAPQSDEAWSNRATYLFARACTVCWDRTLDPAARQAMLTDLYRLLVQWHEALPETYQPWAKYQLPEDPFPTLRFISTWHVVGWQYYYAAKVLVGLYRKPDHLNSLESEVLAPARLLCGTTINSPVFGAVINGTALISWFGQVFSGKEEQTRLLTFLQELMRTTGWPNQTCCDRLQRVWSGESRSWVP